MTMCVEPPLDRFSITEERKLTFDLGQRENNLILEDKESCLQLIKSHGLQKQCMNHLESGGGG